MASEVEFILAKANSYSPKFDEYFSDIHFSDILEKFVEYKTPTKTNSINTFEHTRKCTINIEHKHFIS